MKDKRIYCDKCKEETFRTPDENVFICQGCGNRSPRKRVTKKFVNIDEVDEALLIEPIVENSPQVEARYAAVMGRLHKLSDNEKTAILLLAEGKTQEEVAEIMLISRGEVSTYVNRARIKLK